MKPLLVNCFIIIGLESWILIKYWKDEAHYAATRTHLVPPSSTDWSGLVGLVACLSLRLREKNCYFNMLVFVVLSAVLLLSGSAMAGDCTGENYGCYTAPCPRENDYGYPLWGKSSSGQCADPSKTCCYYDYWSRYVGLFGQLKITNRISRSFKCMRCASTVHVNQQSVSRQIQGMHTEHRMLPSKIHKL